MAATCMAVCKGSRKKIRGIFISSCHLPVAVECDIVILSEPGPIPQAPVGQFCRHNLSPRGDGNITKETEKPLCMDTTYPREGTETYFCFALLSLLSNLTQLIPARGRKRFDLLFFRHLYPTQLIPARGRKRLRRIGRSSRVPDTTYPREGTETPTPPQSRQSGRTQLIPARGRKLRRIGRSSRVPRHNLSPRGDGNLI